MLEHLTTTQVERLWLKVYNRMRMSVAQGDPYGVDWPTLRNVSPAWYEAMKLVNRLLVERYKAEVGR